MKSELDMCKVLAKADEQEWVKQTGMHGEWYATRREKEDLLLLSEHHTTLS